MAFDTSDVISVTQVRDRVHDLAEERLQFRRAFEQMNAPDPTDDSWDIPTDDDTLGEPDEVAEGASYPTDEEAYSTVTATRRKFGQAIPITDEAIEDNAFPIIARLVDKQGRKMQEKLDGEAFTVLDSNLNASSPVTDTDDDTLSWDDILAGKTTLLGDGYDPDLLIVEENGLTDLLTDSDFLRASDFGDQIIVEGEGALGRAGGMTVALSNTGDISTNADAYMIDSRFYGAEVVWRGMEMEQVDERLEDKTYLKARTFRDWVALDSSAAIKVNG